MSSVARTSSVGKVVLWALAVVVALNVALGIVDRATGGAQEGPASSSYSTTGAGVAAYADLLSRHGFEVVRLRRAIADERLEAKTTIVILDAALGPPDVDALRAFVERGGRIVAGGQISATWVGGILPRPPGLLGVRLDTAVPLAPVSEVANVQSVGPAGPGAWDTSGTALPALGSDEGVLLSVARVGEGRIALLASTAPLQNAHLGDADNAALGIALAGERGRSVAFYEHAHGYGEGQGLAALPTRAKVMLLLLGIAAILWMLSRGRRIGAPSLASRDLPPPRRLYLESLATTLARTKNRADAVDPVRGAARSRISRVAGLGPNADDGDVRDAALRIGLTSEEARAVVEQPTSDDDVLAAGRALAKLEARTR